MGQYPPRDSERAPDGFIGAPVVAVEQNSPADDAGFGPGCFITAIDGQQVRDIIDWRWLSADDAIEVSYVDADGDAGAVTLERDPGEDWGFAFDGVVFDGVKLCRNACTFCFMRQLPRGMRPSLSLRDDDFRLSFLSGTFVTLTNLSEEDEQRIIDQRISPLRVSLQAVGAEVRRNLIGRHAAHGLAALERLLDAGIECHAQIVLVPGQNDGEALDETLAWAYARPGILDVGIVPLGYTRHQDVFAESFDDPAAAREVLKQIEPFQQKARAERGHAWVHAADEFYCNAYGVDVAASLPPSSDYGDFDMYEDGIGIARSCVDEWRAACATNTAGECADALRARGMRARLVAGRAMEPYFGRLIAEAGMEDCFSPLYVDNAYFGGNVTVTGLLCGCDIARVIAEARAADGDNADVLFFVPNVVFNDDGLTLDGMHVGDIERAAGAVLHVVSCSPSEYLHEIAQVVNG